MATRPPGHVAQTFVLGAQPPGTALHALQASPLVFQTPMLSSMGPMFLATCATWQNATVALRQYTGKQAA